MIVPSPLLPTTAQSYRDGVLSSLQVGWTDDVMPGDLLVSWHIDYGVQVCENRIRGPVLDKVPVRVL